MIVPWLIALVRRRRGELFGAVAGVALAVALLGSLGSFVAGAKRDMTHRAVAQVPIDWQVEIQPRGDAQAALTALRNRADVKAALPTGFAKVAGLQATSGGTTQSTGAGVAVGLPADYAHAFPRELRTLVGDSTGVLLAQQTAANLHAAPGDTITIQIEGPSPHAVRATVTGVVDLPAADSLFQVVGAPAGAQAQAPPDNVILLPLTEWHSFFDPLRAARPDLVRDQIHVDLDHALPADPASAYQQATSAAKGFEASQAGGVLVGDNLGATLGAARADALYAQVLFVLLGAPGAVLAALLVRSVVAAGRSRRRREHALLRLRGASLRELNRLVLAESAVIAVLGAAIGLVAAFVVGHLAFGATFGATARERAVWVVASAVAGVLIAAVAVALPTRRDAAQGSVAASRRVVEQTAPLIALRYGADVVLLAASAAVFWAASRGKYSLVLAPEGVASVSVSYWQLAGPLLLWIGAGLFAWRATDLLLGAGSGLVRGALRPFVGSLAPPVASSLRRVRRSLSTSTVLLALTVAFAVSVAVFNATYRQQVGVDALLTNGAPVTASAPPTARVDAGVAQRLAAVPGVRHVELLQHRFVYVGNDLQDLYGVDARTIGSGEKLQEAYFSGGTAKQVLARLAATPDGALVSSETALDYQLHQGDRLRLRVRDVRTGKPIEVPFTFAGVVHEFPTAPRDSFIVANGLYVSKMTGDASANIFLMDTNGVSARTVAARVQAVAPPVLTVSNIDDARRVVGSSLTAVDLAALTRLELAYALLLAIATTGLVLGLGLAQRRRSYAIMAALGAKPRQVAAFVRGEAAVFAAIGATLGVVAGWLLAMMLVKVLTGVFDPAPAHLAAPWAYLGAVGVAAATGLVIAAGVNLRLGRRPLAEQLRDL
jgi:putative ABC transport system permease protein